MAAPRSVMDCRKQALSVGQLQQRLLQHQPKGLTPRSRADMPNHLQLPSACHCRSSLPPSGVAWVGLTDSVEHRTDESSSPSLPRRFRRHAAAASFGVAPKLSFQQFVERTRTARRGGGRRYSTEVVSHQIRRTVEQCADHPRAWSW